MAAHLRWLVTLAVDRDLILPQDQGLLASVLGVFWIKFNGDWLDQGPIQLESSGQLTDPITSLGAYMGFLNPAV